MALPKIKECVERMTPEEYLAWERKQKTRHEYVDGEIIAMAGESPEYNEIALNIATTFKNAFRGRPCKVYMQGVRVQVTDTQYRYPDVVAVCGDAAFADTNPKTLLNPGVIFEVLSASTGQKDFVEKLAEYTRLATLTDYVIVAQTQMQVIHHTRQNGDPWTTRIYGLPEAAIRLESLAVTLMLAEIYGNIVFPAPEPEE